MTEVSRPDDPTPPPRRPGGDAGSVVPRGRVTRAPAAERPADEHQSPSRPSLTSENGAPVLVKATPPFSIRLTQLLWILSFAVGGFTTVYYFIVRKELLPEIAKVAESVTKGRSEETYDAAADIVFWVLFAVIVGVLLIQITLLVSFMNRRPQVRWWQLLTLGVQALLVLLSPEWVALGAQGKPLQPLLAAQAALVLLALLFSVFPKAIAWSARRFDVRRGPERLAVTDF